MEMMVLLARMGHQVTQDRLVTLDTQDFQELKVCFDFTFIMYCQQNVEYNETYVIASGGPTVFFRNHRVSRHVRF